ncbi:putative reverse transcriptase domain-containing protein [Tanacetum coccineum]
MSKQETTQIPVNAQQSLLTDMISTWIIEWSKNSNNGPATRRNEFNATKESLDEADACQVSRTIIRTRRTTLQTTDVLTSIKLSAIVTTQLEGPKTNEEMMESEYKRETLCSNNCIFTERITRIECCQLVGYHDGMELVIRHRVDTYDASTKENFNLRAVVLWTINNYPTLGTLCGCLYSGFKGCVVCGKDTHCVRLSASSKATYAPNLLTVEQIYNAYNILKIIGEKGKTDKHKTSENQEDTEVRGGKQFKSKIVENNEKEEGKSNQVNEAYGRKFNHLVSKAKVDTLTNAGKDLLFVKRYPTSGVPQGYVQIPRLVKRELAISKDNVSETVRWISYGPRATIVKYEAYNINGYTISYKSNDDIVYLEQMRNPGVVDHIRFEVSTSTECIAQLNAVVAEFEAMKNQEEVHDSWLAAKDARRDKQGMLIINLDRFLRLSKVKLPWINPK